MKTLLPLCLLFTLALVFCTQSFAQAPARINYQAVARNAGGQTLINQAVSVRLSVRQSNAGGTIQYQETHNLSTTAQGLINLQIGGGTPNLDTFADITWTDGQPKFLQIELDPDGPLGAQTYVNMGVQQLVSVPYALYSEEAKWVKVSGTNMRIGDTNYNLGSTGNIAIGKSALNSTTVGVQNIAVGFEALSLNVSGTTNNAFGYTALKSNTTGNFNNAFGRSALEANNGFDNTAMGDLALWSNTTGNDNTALGSEAMYLNTTGVKNTACGKKALNFNNTGSNNVALGSEADVLVGNLIYAAAIGAGAKVGTSNCMVLGGTGVASVYVGIGLNTPTSDFHIKQTANTNQRGIRLEFASTTNNWRTYIDGALDYNFAYNDLLKAYILDDTGAYTVASDLRLKKDISPITAVLPKIMQLQPKTYRYNDNKPDARLSYGFIAQEVETIFPDFVDTKADTGMKAIAYDNFAVIAIQAIKEQQEMIAAQNATIQQLQQKAAEVDALKAELQQIKALLLQGK